MEMVFVEDRTKLQEIIHGLPSHSIMWKPNVILIKQPITEKYIVLKSRYTDEKTKTLDPDLFKMFSERRNWNDEYNDLYKKFIIFDGSLLNNSGKEALISFE